MILLTVMARCSAPIGLERAIFTPAGIPRRGASGGCALEGRLHRPVRGAFDGRIGDLGPPPATKRSWSLRSASRRDMAHRFIPRLLWVLFVGSHTLLQIGLEQRSRSAW